MSCKHTLLRNRCCPGESGHDGSRTNRKGLRARWILGLLLMTPLVATSLMSCASNMATGERHFNMISESQEIEMGREADAQVIASLGLYPDSALQRYVQELGTRLAQNSERPNLPWTFRVIDDPGVNAFALPGGFIYVTRGLMAHVMNEAQLAAVVGHEIGHVTAQHSVHRMSEQQLTQLGVVAGMMIKPDLQRYGDYVNAGLGLLSLKFSRDDENQADHLGFRYMVRAEKDPREMIEVFDMLNRVTEAGGGSRVPEWLATHPSPTNRGERLQKELDTLSLDPASLAVNQNSYLRLLDGMVFGKNPREGYFQDNRYYHPELEFEFTFPRNWQTANLREGVVAVSENQEAIIQITMTQASSAAEASRVFFEQESVQGERQESTTINGLPTVSARFSAQDGEQALRGRAMFVEMDGNTYQLLGYSSDQLWAGYENVSTDALRSFRRVTDPTILSIQPMRLNIITVDQRVSLEQLARQERSPVLLEGLALINQTTTSAQFNSGDRVKIVTGEVLVSRTAY